MGTRTAQVSRTMFDEQKLFQSLVAQAGPRTPLMAEDVNDGQDIFMMLMRRIAADAFRNGARGDAFKVSERRDGGPLVPNDLALAGTSSPWWGGDRLWVGGYAPTLFDVASWLTAKEIAPRNTGMTECELYDSEAFWATDELVGRVLMPNLDQPGNLYTITANTANSITVDPADTMMTDGANPLGHYRILLTTPSGADRTDIVYLDVFVDEIDALDDPALVHTNLTAPREVYRRNGLIQTVLVAEGGNPPGSPDDVVELVSDAGNVHYMIPLARLERLDGVATIDDSQITDLRPKIFALSEMEDRYVNVDGDRMRAGELAFANGVRLRAEGSPILGSGEMDLESVLAAHLSRVQHLLGDGGVVPPAGVLPTVHDNRYIPISLLMTLFGPNLIRNGGFRYSLGAWESNEPMPLSSEPAHEGVANVRVGWRLCSPDGCGGVFVHFHEGYRGCRVGVVQQELDICGGGMLAWALNAVVTQGPAGVAVKPSVRLTFISSEQRLGDRDVAFDEDVVSEVEAVGTPPSAACVVGSNVGPFNILAGAEKLVLILDGVQFEATLPLATPAAPAQVTAVSDAPYDIQGGQEHLHLEVEGVDYDITLTVGATVAIATVLAEINAVIGPAGADVGVASDDGGGALVVTTKNAGATITLEVEDAADSAHDKLGLAIQSVTGSAAVLVPIADVVDAVEDEITGAGAAVDDGGALKLCSVLTGAVSSVTVKTDAESVHAVLGFDLNEHNGDDGNLVDYVSATTRQAACITTAHGLRRLRQMVDVPTAVDKVLITIELEVIHDDCELGELVEVVLGNVRAWKFADEGSVVNGDYLPPPEVLLGVGDVVPQANVISVGGSTGETAIQLGEARNVPIPVEWTGEPGELRFLPDAHQQTLLVLRTAREDAAFVYDYVANEHHHPQLRLALPVKAPEITDADVAVPPVGLPPRVHTISHLEIELGQTPHVVITGRDFDPLIAISWIGFAVSGGGLQILNVVVTPTQIDFDVTTDQSVVAGMFTLYLENPDGQKTWVAMEVTNAGQVPEPTDIKSGKFGLGVGDDQKVMVMVLDQYSQPMAGVAVGAVSNVPANCTITASAITNHFGLALFTATGVVAGSCDVDFTAGAVVLNVPFQVQPTPQILVDALVASIYGKRTTSGGLDALTVEPFDDGPASLSGIQIMSFSTSPAIADVIPVNLTTASAGAFTIRSHAPGLAFTYFMGGGIITVVPAIVDGGGAPPVYGKPAFAHTGVLPAQLDQSVDQLLHILGDGLLPGTAVQITTPGAVVPGAPKFYPTRRIIQLELPGDATLGEVDITLVAPDGEQQPLDRGLIVTATDVDGPGDIGYPTLDADVADVDQALRILCDPNENNTASTLVELAFGGAQSQAPGHLIDFTGASHVSVRIAGRVRAVTQLSFGFVDVTDKLAVVIAGSLTHVPAANPPLGQNLVLSDQDGFTTFEFVLSPALQPQGFDWSQIKAMRFSLIPDGRARGIQSTIWFDTIELVPGTANPGPNTLVEDFSLFTTQAELDPYVGGVSSLPVLQLHAPISRRSTPVVVAPRDQPFKVRFHGDAGWQTADVVLVRGLSANEGAGELEPGTGIAWGVAYYQTAAPVAGCRSAFLDFAHIADSGCFSLAATSADHDHYTSGCACSPDTPEAIEVGSLVTALLFHRLLPDDGFAGSPALVYPEAFTLEYCNAGVWTQLGSQSTPAQVVHAGGGRNDPNEPAGVPEAGGEPIFATIYHGPGSNQSERESRIAVDVDGLSITDTPVDVDITVSPGAITGFGVGLPVWLRNACDGESDRKLALCEVESGANAQITGLYGEVIAVDSENDVVTVRFPSVPGHLDAIGDLVAPKFMTEWSAALMVAPRDSMGFYWEASPGLVNAAGGDSTNVRWWFKRWEAPLSGCTATSRYEGGAVLLANGNGTQQSFGLEGDSRRLIDPGAWRKTWEHPLATCDLKADALPGETEVVACFADRFQPGDLLRLVDDDHPLGWQTVVENVDPDGETITIADPIPSVIDEDGSFGGFLVSKKGMCWAPVTVAHKALAPTTRRNGDGTPMFAGHAGIDFEAGRVHFERSFSGRVRVLWCSAVNTVQLPALGGSYLLQAVNTSGVVGEHSARIGVTPLLDWQTAPGV